MKALKTLKKPYYGGMKCSHIYYSLECFPLIKGFEVQNFEPILFCKHKSACFKLVVKDGRKKSEVNFEADYVSDSFMDKNTKFDVHFSKPKWN